MIERKNVGSTKDRKAVWGKTMSINVKNGFSLLAFPVIKGENKI